MYLEAQRGEILEVFPPSFARAAKDGVLELCSRDEGANVIATWTGSRYCFLSSGLSFLSSLALSSLGVLSSLLFSSFAFSSIDNSSTSKIRVALGPISAPAPRSPYARLEGTNSCHFDPTGISCSASVHALIT